MKGHSRKVSLYIMLLISLFLFTVAVGACTPDVEPRAALSISSPNTVAPTSMPEPATGPTSTREVKPPIPTATNTATPTLTATVTPTVTLTPTMTPQRTATQEQEAGTVCPYCPTPTATRWWEETSTPPCNELPAEEYPCIYTVQASGSYDETTQQAYNPLGSANPTMVTFLKALNRNADGTYQDLVPGTLLYLPSESSLTDIPLRDFPYCGANEKEPPCWYWRRKDQSYADISEDVFKTPNLAEFILKHNNDPSPGYIMIPISASD